MGSFDRGADSPATDRSEPTPGADPRPADCDHYGFVRAVRNRDAPAFQIHEHVLCSRCGQSFGVHVGRP